MVAFRGLLFSISIKVGDGILCMIMDKITMIHANLSVTNIFCTYLSDPVFLIFFVFLLLLFVIQIICSLICIVHK